MVLDDCGLSAHHLLVLVNLNFLSINSQLQLQKLDFLKDLSIEINLGRSFGLNFISKLFMNMRSTLKQKKLLQNEIRTIRALFNNVKLLFSDLNMAHGDTGYRMREKFRERFKFSMFQVISRAQLTKLRLTVFETKSYIRVNRDLPNDVNLPW